MQQSIRARIFHVPLYFLRLFQTNYEDTAHSIVFNLERMSPSTQTLISGNQSFYVLQWLKLCNHTRNTHSRAASFPLNRQINFSNFPPIFF